MKHHTEPYALRAAGFRVRGWLFFCIIVLLIVGCSPTNRSTTPTRTTHTATLSVAMVLPGTVDDGSWNQAGYEGLKRLEQELGATTAYRASVAEADFAAALRGYAEADFDFIIGHGSQFVAAAEVVAEEFPKTQFAVIGPYEGNNKNLGALRFYDNQMGYLAGAAAALATTSGHVAFIGGVAHPHMQEQAAAFERGARALNPDVTVSEAWVESWDDEEQARALVRKTSQQGADVLLINLDVDSTAAHDEAAQMGVSVIAWVYDQPEVTSDAVIATVIQGVPVIMLEGAKLVQQDRWEGRLYKFGLHEEAQYLTPAPGDFTSEEQQRLDDMAYAILTGKIDVSPARE